jgi:thymidine phosphorylase
VVALLTRMEAPLGRAVGNALETREALEVLRGSGPEDLVECTIALAAEMIVLGGKAADREQGAAAAREAIRSGRASRVMERMVAAQGGDARVVSEPERLPRASRVESLVSASEGWVCAIDALEVGKCCVALGAGRTRADQGVDPAVGVVLSAPVGARVRPGEPLAEVHARSEDDVAAVRGRLLAAFELTGDQPERKPLVIERIET